MTAILIAMLLAAQPPDDYLLIGDREPVQAQEPIREPDPWGWHKLKDPPAYIQTSWVWGYKDPATRLINWTPDDQPAAWEKAGKQMPGWVLKDSYGDEWQHWNADVLREHVRRINAKRQALNASTRVVTRPISSPLVRQAPVSRSFTRSFSSVCVGSS